ncbi:hypothetical protein C0995_015428 [Termitomyces sp. Mi166|nr:hypothetical protein C0995_015428 [Termitomyces sp. Mi166\
MIIALAALHQLSTSQDAGPPSSLDDLVPASSCNNRKTFNIVWSCLTTIFACTWIAVHPNLPVNGEWPFVRRLKIFVLALIAPELIVSWALRQWISSRRLARIYKDYGWTQTHGFFAIMGGFQICESDGTGLRTLKVDELEPYVKDHAITVSKEEILDKSKGDFLSKALVLLQVSWFVLQILARANQHLAITELEFVTLGYAILNFVTYFCWLNKPLDVQYPIKITTRSEVTSTDSPTPSTTPPHHSRDDSELSAEGYHGQYLPNDNHDAPSSLLTEAQEREPTDISLSGHEFWLSLQRAKKIHGPRTAHTRLGLHTKSKMLARPWLVWLQLYWGSLIVWDGTLSFQPKPKDGYGALYPLPLRPFRLY